MLPAETRLLAKLRNVEDPKLVVDWDSRMPDSRGDFCLREKIPMAVDYARRGQIQKAVVTAKSCSWVDGW